MKDRAIEIQLDKYFHSEVESYIIEHYDEIKNEIIKCNDEFTMDFVCTKISDILKKRRNPLYKSERPIFFDNNILYANVESTLLNKLVSDNLPLSVKKVSVTMRFLKENPDFLNKHDIEQLNIIGKMNINDYLFLTSYKQLKKVNCDFIEYNVYMENIPDNTCLIGDGIYSTIYSDKLIVSTNNYVVSKINYSNCDNKTINGALKYILKSKKIKNVNIRKLDKISLKNNLNNNPKVYESILKYLNGICILEYNINHGYDSFLNIIKLFKDSNIKIDKYIIRVENKTYPNFDRLSKIENDNNISIEVNYGDAINASISDFILMRNTIDYYKSLINNSGCSQAEKLMYAYDLIKWYEYHDDESNLNDSMYIHSALRTGKIVCVGYAKFFSQLLNELGIEATPISIYVPVYENGEKQVHGHERNLVKIKDEKYGIDGIYAFDPTWDSAEYAIDTKTRDLVSEEYYASDDFDKENMKKLQSVSSLYRYIFITKGMYQKYFEGEELPKIHDVDESTEILMSYKDNKEISEDIIYKLIYNTRLKEGYKKQQLDNLFSEIEEFRRRKVESVVRMC